MKNRGKAWMGSGALSSAIVALMLAVSGAASGSAPVPVNVCDYNTNEPQVPGQGMWTDIRRGAQISMTDSPCTLNFTGWTGSAGDMWITMKGVPGAVLETHLCWDIDATVVIKRFDNLKAVGFVTNYDPINKTGLFFGIYDAGNTDAMKISTFDGATGQLKTQLAARSLGSKVKENTAYQLELGTCVEDTGDFSLQFSFNVDNDECNADSDCIVYNGSLPSGIVSVGAAGIAGYAKNAFVDSQVTNIEIKGGDVGE